MRAGPRRFHGGIQRQDVGLKGNAVHHADDLGNTARAFGDGAHGAHHALHGLAALFGYLACVQRQGIGLACALRIFGQALHRHPQRLRGGKARGDVGGEFHHFERPALGVEDGVIAGFDPHLAAVLADTQILPGVVFAGAQLAPKLLIGRAARLFRAHKHAVVAAFYFRGLIAHGFQKQLVGANDGAVEFKFDNRLHFGYRRQLPFGVGLAMLLVGNVGGVLHHLQRLPALIEDGVVGGLQPDIAAVFANTAITSGVVGALPQLVPKRRVFRGFAFSRIDEHGVMLAQHFVQGISHGVQEILIRHQHMALEIEFDHGLGLVNGGYLTVQVRLPHTAISTEQPAECSPLHSGVSCQGWDKVADNDQKVFQSRTDWRVPTQAKQCKPRRMHYPVCPSPQRRRNLQRR
ncbi:hypothetical protein D3C71_1118400 [compost metagenome]